LSKLKDYFNRKRIKKTSGHTWFYHDDSYGFDFYYKFTNENDISILSFDTKGKTYREFILDEVIIRAMFEAIDGADISRDYRFIQDKMVTPSIAKDYIDAGFTMLKKTGNSKFANVVVLAKVGNFGADKVRSKSFILRRVVYNDTLIIGMDTLALPLNAIKSFVKKMEVYFKAEREIVERGTKYGSN
jgi:hypothetical protein